MNYLLNLDEFKFHRSIFYGSIFFQIGLFILPSSALLGSVALLIASILPVFQRTDSFWKDKWNYPLVVVAVWMIIGSIKAYSGWLAWIGLANWLPFFWLFWGLQPYLRSSNSRKSAALCLVAGTVPVVVTGFGQLWFGWEGPWELFNGLIVWFISPGGQPNGRLAGLFDYANIAAAWLVVAWPFSLAALIQPYSNWRHRSIAFFLAIAIVIALVLTDSRNAWGGLLVAIPFVLGPVNWFWLLPFLIILLLPVAFAVLPGIHAVVQDFSRKIVPDALWSRLNDMRFVESRPLQSTRLSQWTLAIDFVSQRPWFGWGAAAFSVLYPLRTGLSHGHSHNLPLELAVAHGFPVSIFVVSMVLALLIICIQRGVLLQGALKNGELHSTVFDRAWWTATFLLICLHATDLPFFDSRINLVGWVLLAGLRCLLLSLNLSSRAKKYFSTP